MSSNEERERRYLEAISQASSLYGEYDVEDQADSVMAVADAEQADLRARLTRYERHAEALTTPCCLEYAEAAAMAVEQAGNAGFMEAAADSWASSFRLQKTRAEAAEAKVARVEALIQAEEQRVLEANERFTERGVVEPKTGGPLRLAGIVPTRDLRAALDGDE